MDSLTVWWNKVFGPWNVLEDCTTVAIPSDNASSDTSSEDGVEEDGGLRGLQRFENTSTGELKPAASGGMEIEGSDCDNVCDSAVSGDIVARAEMDISQNYPLRDMEWAFEFGKDGNSEGYSGDDKSELGVESEGDLDSYSGCYETGSTTKNVTDAPGIIEHSPTPESPIPVVEPTSPNFDTDDCDFLPKGVAVYLHTPTKEITTPYFPAPANKKRTHNISQPSAHTTDAQVDETNASQPYQPPAESPEGNWWIFWVLRAMTEIAVIGARYGQPRPEPNRYQPRPTDWTEVFVAW